MTDTSTSADFSSVADSADTSTEAAPSQADSFDEGDNDYESLPDYGEVDELDEGDADYASLPDHGAPDDLDPELSYDTLPDHAADTSTEPQPWAQGETIQLSNGDSPPAVSNAPDGPEVEAARAGVAEALDAGERQEAARVEVREAFDAGERQQTARDAVDAAYAQAASDGVPPNSPEGFEAEAQRAIDEAPSDTGAKQVEFQDPTEASSPEAVPVEQGDVPQFAESPNEVHSPEEQRVVDDAKSDLASREQAGEHLGGDPMGRADQWHQQGQNDLGYQQDCALASTSAVLRDCGVDASESDVVDQAASAGLCETGNANPADNGGVQDGEAISELLSENGVENRIENPQDVEELAAYVEQGHGVITEIDAEELWGTPTEYSPAYYDADGRSNVNHAVQVTGTVRDSSGELTGIVVNDTGSPDGAGTVVPTEKWDACWSNTNNDHETVVTSRPTSVERAGR